LTPNGEVVPTEITTQQYVVARFGIAELLDEPRILRTVSAACVKNSNCSVNVASNLPRSLSEFCVLAAFSAVFDVAG
jgi:hypothetical protein